MHDHDVEKAVDELAESLAHALRVPAGGNGLTSDGDFSLCGRAPGRDGGAEARLAALRVLGVDALAPFVLTGRRPGPDDVELVRESIVAFPAPRGEEGSMWLWEVRDRALTEMLRSPDPAATVSVPERVTGDGLPWAQWSVEMARLSSLALPQVHGGPRAGVVRRRLDLARGLTRAILRRDFLTAARLARWQALDHGAMPDPNLPAAVEHIALLAKGRPRVRLELAVARVLIERSR